MLPGHGRVLGVRLEFAAVRTAHPLLVAAIAVAVSVATSSPALAARSTECQHPVLTGVEVSHLSHVSTATACHAALALHSWEIEGNHASMLYRCPANPAGRPVLKKHSFDGWALSITRAGAFQMAHGASSFYVSGTDFPIACN